MNIELRQWCFGDEESLINLYDHYDRSFCKYRNPEPGTCSESSANRNIRCYVDMSYDGRGYSRKIVVDDKVVGHVQITKRRDIYDANCDLDIFILPEYCNKGIGTWAVKEMIDFAFNSRYNFEGLFATLFETNKAAARMFEKAGLRFLGVDDSFDWKLNGISCKKIVYGIRRPKKELKNTGVEIKAWECRDIDYLADLFNKVDKRYDDLPDPLVDISRMSEEEIEELDPKERHRRTLFCMHDYVNDWNYFESCGSDIYRAIINDGEVVGLITLQKQHGKQSIDAKLGYMMMPEHCGKGIATKAVKLMLDEAFTNQGLHRVTAWVYAPNKASSRVLEKNGFALEGVKKEGVLCEGVPTDYLMYGILCPKKS